MKPGRGPRRPEDPPDERMTAFSNSSRGVGGGAATGGRNFRSQQTRVRSELVQRRPASSPRQRQRYDEEYHSSAVQRGGGANNGGGSGGNNNLLNNLPRSSSEDDVRRLIRPTSSEPLLEPYLGVHAAPDDNGGGGGGDKYESAASRQQRQQAIPPQPAWRKKKVVVTGDSIVSPVDGTPVHQKTVEFDFLTAGGSGGGSTGKDGAPEEEAAQRAGCGGWVPSTCGNDNTDATTAAANNVPPPPPPPSTMARRQGQPKKQQQQQPAAATTSEEDGARFDDNPAARRSSSAATTTSSGRDVVPPSSVAALSSPRGGAAAAAAALSGRRRHPNSEEERPGEVITADYRAFPDDDDDDNNDDAKARRGSKKRTISTNLEDDHDHNDTEEVLSKWGLSSVSSALLATKKRFFSPRQKKDQIVIMADGSETVVINLEQPPPSPTSATPLAMILPSCSGPQGGNNKKSARTPSSSRGNAGSTGRTLLGAASKDWDSNVGQPDLGQRSWSHGSSNNTSNGGTAAASDTTEKLMKEASRDVGDNVPRCQFLRRVGAFVCSSGFIYMAMFFSMAAGLTYGAIKEYDLFNKIDWDEELLVAFAGSSYLFVNDIPRVMEAISDGQIVQDSCLHAGGSLAALVMTGNGMYRRWQTVDALVQVPYADANPYANNNYNNYNYNNNNNDDQSQQQGDDDGEVYMTTVYDYGACSIHQLLSGEDQYIKYGNDNKAYYNDGNNPCILDENYLYFMTQKYQTYTPKWDYVVLADQTKRMASSQARYDTVDALVSVYAPLLEESGAIPVIVDTHAFWSSQTNMTGLTDIPTFTRLIYEGVEEYVEALASALPTDQAPIVVPIGLAYLTVWEENYAVWETLFLSDEMHASLYGSYLFACVLYTKLFGHLPKKSVSVPDHIEYLFTYSRKIIGQGSVSYPTSDEAAYLRGIAKRVVLEGHVPKSYQKVAASDDDYQTDDLQY